MAQPTAAELQAEYRALSDRVLREFSGPRADDILLARLQAREIEIVRALMALGVQPFIGPRAGAR